MLIVVATTTVSAAVVAVTIHVTAIVIISRHEAEWALVLVAINCKTTSNDSDTNQVIFTSAKEVMFLPEFVCLSVC